MTGKGGVLFDLSIASVVTVVGFVAAGLLVLDLVRHELAGSPAVSRRYRHLGAAVTVAFVALVVVRFVVHGE